MLLTAGVALADRVVLEVEDVDPMTEEQQWQAFADRLPATADALNFVIERSAECLRKHCAPATAAAWEQQRPELRQQLQRTLGLDPWPRRTPLRPRVTGRTELNGLIVENVVFESRPRFYVTANVYRRPDLKAPAPGVVVVPGHAMAEGKNYPLYRLVQLQLARLGFVVLAYDPIGQGERRFPEYGHQLGYALLLVGQCNEGLIVWDTMRALDYLAARPEVDAERLGLAGNSGGGENTFYTMPLDPRIKAGTSFCFVCSYAAWLRDGGSHCICNHLPGIVQQMEQFQIAALNAPRPFLIGNGRDDPIFPITGTRETVAATRRIYALLGAEDRLKAVEAPAKHGWHRPLREAAYGWLCRWLQGRGDGSPIPEDADLDAGEPDQPALLCFKDGAALPDDAVTLISLARDRVAKLAGAFPRPPADAAAWETWASALKPRVWRVLGNPPKPFPPTAELGEEAAWRGHRINTVALHAEPELVIAGVLIRPSEWKPGGDAILFVSDEGKAHARREPRVQHALRAGVAVLAVDLRGTGETAVHEHQLASDAICLGRPLLAQHVWDVMQATKWLREGVAADRICFYGHGRVGFIGAVAAALEAPLSRLALAAPPASLTYAIEAPIRQPLWLYAPGLLEVADVAQILGLAAPRPCFVFDAAGSSGRAPLPDDEAVRTLRPAASVYRLFGAVEHFRVGTALHAGDDAKLRAFIAFAGSD